MMTREQRRLFRQFAMLERTVPSLRGPLGSLRKGHWMLLRLPLGVIFVLGGIFSFLPVLGIWMLPLGLLLLAVDLPFLRKPVNALVIRSRRRIELWRRRFRDWRGRRPR